MNAAERGARRSSFRNIVREDTHMTRKLMALALALAFLMSMAALGEEGPLAKYDELVTVDAVGLHNVGWAFAAGEDANNNVTTRIIERELNIKVNYLWTSEHSGYYSKLSLDIANDDLPDLFQASASQVATMVRNGQLMEMSGVFEEYAVEGLKNDLANPNMWAPVTFDGGVYAIPVVWSGQYSRPVMWVRSDWLDKLGMEPPATLDELTILLQGIKDEGLANGGGAGFGFDGLGWVFDSVAAAYGAYPWYWVKDDAGVLNYSTLSPQMRECLEFLQDLYADGLIDADFAVKGKSFNELCADGTYGVVFGHMDYPYNFYASLLNDPEADWIAVPIPTLMGDQQIVPKEYQYWADYYVVSADCEHPEVLIKLMNMYFELVAMEGIYSNTLFMEIVDEAIAKGSNFQQGWYPFSFYPSTNGLIQYGALKEVWTQPTEEEMRALADASAILNVDVINDIWLNEDDERHISVGWAIYAMVMQGGYDSYFAYDRMQANEFYGVLSDDNQFALNQLNDKLTETFLNIIMGEDIAKFDDMLAAWANEGGAEIEEEVNK